VRLATKSRGYFLVLHFYSWAWIRLPTTGKKFNIGLRRGTLALLTAVGIGLLMLMQ